jgi:GNAT superfamily N-acetyltransferase
MMPKHPHHHHLRGHLRAVVVPTTPQYARPLEKIQPLIFPTLKPEELFTEAHYLHHHRLFPQGQFTALVHQDGHWVVAGSTVTFRINFSFFEKEHSFEEAIDSGWLSNHNPEGEWLYGADVSVHPDYRGLGLSKMLYDARRALVRPGYHRYRDQMDIETYVDKVVAGELTDPTLTAQVRSGFRVKRVLYNHITDPRSNNCAALIVRQNPQYHPSYVYA